MKLKKGQVLYIDNYKYVVSNMIEYSENTWIWQEYEIISEQNIHKWLSIEQNEYNQTEYYLYEKYTGIIDTNEIEFYANNQTYELHEKGQAQVKDYFGNADVDRYEICEYFDYISKDKTTILSIEKWEGETERSIGTYIESQRIYITEEIEHNKQEQVANIKNTILKVIFVIILLLLPSISFLPQLFSSIFVNKSIQKYMENKETYTYVTSITNNTNNQKAKVYESSLSSIDLTVKDIIDGVPEEITETIDSEPNTDEDGIGLQTKNEYAYVYKEKGKIYVQVSNKKYVNSGGSTYHSHHRHYYHTGFTSTRRSTTYSNYASSARQSSVNSRTLSGGGTSSGK